MAVGIQHICIIKYYLVCDFTYDRPAMSRTIVLRFRVHSLHLFLDLLCILNFRGW